jgi:hypothetical protein
MRVAGIEHQGARLGAIEHHVDADQAVAVVKRQFGRKVRSTLGRMLLRERRRHHDAGRDQKDEESAH